MHTSTNPALTTQSQSLQVRPVRSTLDAVDVQASAAYVKLGTLERINTLPATTNSNNVNRVQGLIDRAQMTCTSMVGSRSRAFNVFVANAPQASLLVECVAANNLQLSNTNGACLTVWLPRAQRITMVDSNRTVEMFIDPLNPPRVVDVNGMKSWGYVAMGCTVFGVQPDILQTHPLLLTQCTWARTHKHKGPRSVEWGPPAQGPLHSHAGERSFAIHGATRQLWCRCVWLRRWERNM